MTPGRADATRGVRFLPVLLRVFAVTVTVYPAVRKFFQYSNRVSEFGGYGIPWPEVAVVLAGVVEVFAVVSLAFGIAGRLGAVTLAGTMAVAIVFAGPNPFSTVVLVASLGLCVLGTGPYSMWDPTFGDLADLFDSGRTAGFALTEGE